MANERYTAKELAQKTKVPQDVIESWIVQGVFTPLAENTFSNRHVEIVMACRAVLGQQRSPSQSKGEIYAKLTSDIETVMRAEQEAAKIKAFIYRIKEEMEEIEAKAYIQAAKDPANKNEGLKKAAVCLLLANDPIYEDLKQKVSDKITGKSILEAQIGAFQHFINIRKLRYRELIAEAEAAAQFAMGGK